MYVYVYIYIYNTFGITRALKETFKWPLFRNSLRFYSKQTSPMKIDKDQQSNMRSITNDQFSVDYKFMSQLKQNAYS